MGPGASIILMAAGAILRWAVDTSDVHDVNLRTVGLILLVVGAVGFVVSLLFWTSWGGVGRRRGYDGPPGPPL